MPEATKKGEISAEPTKSFFISTLIKDIQLIDAVLDLIDNSIDAYLENKIKDRKIIKINFDNDFFVIEDDCGGMDKKNIYNKIFRFGMPKQIKAETIGVFGIGMKRAIFKMGGDILIESDDGKNYYSIKIDKKWMDDDTNWWLDFKNEDLSRRKPFTKITIKDLHSSIKKELGSTSFENSLREKIKDAYSIFINEKVNIKVKGKSVEPYDFNFLMDNKHFEPYHKKFKWGKVEVEIYAGFTPGDILETKTYGWYIFCNDRLVIRSDTTSRTGWGGPDGKTYHYAEDNRFLGLVFFRSEQTVDLPWHTTKEDIQEDSPIYKKAQVEMRTVTNMFIDVIRLAGRTKDKETGETIGRSIFKGIPSKTRNEIKKESKGMVPVVKGEIIPSELTSSEWTNISYSERKKLVKIVKKKLGNYTMPNREVGEKTFDYFVKMEQLENDE